MSDDTVIAEFGSSKINIGLPGEGIPMKIYTTVGNNGFLVAKNNNTNNKGTNDSSNSHHHSLRASSKFSAINHDFLLLDLESCGLSSSTSYLSSSSSSSLSFTTDFQIKQSLFGNFESNNNHLIPDSQIAAQILSQMMHRCQAEEANNLMMVIPDSVFLNDKAFESWAETAFAASFDHFFPLRPAIAATIDSGRSSAVVLDCGHACARINVVVDGVQRVSHQSFAATSIECGGKYLSTVFEKEMFGDNNNNNNNSNNSNQQEDAASSPHQVSSSKSAKTDAINNSNKKSSLLVASSTLESSLFPWNSNQKGASISSSSVFNTFSRSTIVREAKHSCGVVAPSLVLPAVSVKEDEAASFSQQVGGDDDDDESDDEENDNTQQQHQQQKKKLRQAASSASSSSSSSALRSAVYIAPDGEQLHFEASSRSWMFERLFSSSTSTSAADDTTSASTSSSSSTSSPSLVRMATDCFNALPVHYRAQLPLLVVGGTARTEGFASRFATELQAESAIFEHMPPRYPQDPYGQWRGATFVCGSPAFAGKGSWISKQKIEEEGITRIRCGLP